MKKSVFVKAVAVGLVMGLMFSLAGCGTDKEKELDLNGPERLEDGGISVEPDDGTAVDPVGGPAVEPDDGREEKPSDLPDAPMGTNVAPVEHLYALMFDDIYQGVGDSNLMYSPMSLDYMLGMLSHGADIPVKDAISSYLGTYPEQEADAVQAYMASLPDSVKISNGIFVAERHTLNKDVAAVLADKYQAAVWGVDFASPDALTAINGWCDTSTNGLIPVLFDAFRGDEDAVVANALYFKQSWKETVSDGDVWDGEFHNRSGSDSTVSMMHFSVDGYMENPYAEAFVKYYDGGRFCFIGVLPKDTGDFDLADLHAYGFVPGKENGVNTFVTMPEFTFENSMVLNDALADGTIGLGGLFGDGALIGLLDGESAHLDLVIQKTKVIVDREGTEAAAVTAGTVKADAVMEPVEVHEINLDRPFAFVIYDCEAHEMLFMGKVTEL